MVLMGVVERDHFLKVVVGQRIFAEVEQGNPHIPMTKRYQQWVTGTLGSGKRLLCKLACFLMLRAHKVIEGLLAQRLAGLRHLAHLQGQVSNPGVGFFHFRRMRAEGTSCGHTQGRLERKLLLIAGG